MVTEAATTVANASNVWFQAKDRVSTTSKMGLSRVLIGFGDSANCSQGRPSQDAIFFSFFQAHCFGKSFDD
jgi:hypothetical protein